MFAFAACCCFPKQGSGILLGEYPTVSPAFGTVPDANIGLEAEPQQNRAEQVAVVLDRTRTLSEN